MKLFKSRDEFLPGQYCKGYRIIKTIGEGKFGICYLVTDEKNLYILKRLKEKVYKGNPMKARYEEEIIRALNHEAIPRFVSKVEDRHLMGYILEYKQGTTLEAVIFGQRHVFTRNEIYNMGKQLINIMKYLHGKGIVHRDIRVPNILLDGDRIYLVDFGLARRIDNKKYKAAVDFSYFGDFLIHLYYTSFAGKLKKNRPWYEELSLSNGEFKFLKRLMGIEERYKSISEVESEFEEAFSVNIIPPV